MPDEYKPTDLEFPDDDTVVPSSIPAAPAKPAAVFDDSVSNEWEKRQLSGEDELKVDHTFRNIIIGVVIAVAAVGGGVIYVKSTPSSTPKAPAAPVPVAPVEPADVQPPVIPQTPEPTPSQPVEQSPVEVKCNFSSEPPGNLKWDCGSKVVESSIEFDEKKSTKDNYGGVFTFTTVDGQDVNCAFTLQKPKDRTKQQRLDSSLDCKLLTE